MTSHAPITLNPEQTAAVRAMRDFVVAGKEQFFVLSGSAGTGKTTCIRELVNLIVGRVCFTAPFNKAVRTLAAVLTDDDYRPECCTTYSLLGLRMEANGECKVLSTLDADRLDITQYRVVVVDEGSTVNRQLFGYIQLAADSGVQFIFMGDAAQLPPIGEEASPIWDIPAVATLKTVMRHDNQILQLATHLRDVQANPYTRVNLASSNDAAGGVYKLPLSQFTAKLREYAHEGEFSRPNRVKAIAWRNIIVNGLNQTIRREIFDSRETWLEGDRIIVAAPAKDIEGQPMASTDDEGVVDRVQVLPHPLYPAYDVYVLSVTLDTNKKAVLWSLHERSQANFAAEKQRMLIEARAKGGGRHWQPFWNMMDAFHDVRYGYAITAHRAQGSTYDTVFIDSVDILKNSNRKEAMQCLYVACTRPRNRLFIC